MYENLAWNNFIKTGNVESFLEYKKILEMSNYVVNNRGGKFNETDKNQGNSDKRDLL